MSVRFDKQRLSDMSSYQKDPILKMLIQTKMFLYSPKKVMKKKYNSMSNLEHKLR